MIDDYKAAYDAAMKWAIKTLTTLVTSPALTLKRGEAETAASAMAVLTREAFVVVEKKINNKTWYRVVVETAEARYNSRHYQPKDNPHSSGSI